MSPTILRTSCVFWLSAFAVAQEPTPAEPVRQFTPQTFVDEGPASTANELGPAAFFPEGPAIVVEFPPDYDRPDVPSSMGKHGTLDLDSVPPEFLHSPYYLGFAHNLYHPPLGERIDPQLVHRVVTGPRPGELQDATYGYVMFAGRITDQKKARLEDMGVTLLRYHPNNCYAARIPIAVAVDLAEMPEVYWVGHARPSQKVEVLLHQGIHGGRLAGEIPIFVNLFESDLGPTSYRVPGTPPSEVDPHGERAGNPEASDWSWQTNGRVQRALEARGFRVRRYWEEIHAYEGWASASTIYELAKLDVVSFVEWSPSLAAGHDRHVPQMSHDYVREVTQATTQTVGVIDSGFDLYNGRGGALGHVDLNKWGVGWNHWGNGQPHSNVWFDELNQGYHGTHVAGTIMGSGSANIALRGFSPYLGSQGGHHRCFFAKCFCYDAFSRMRSDYNDGTSISPRPFVISNSWRAGGCLDSNPPTSTYNVPANYVGTDAGSRLTDDEVFDQNQLYVFCSGNEGDCNSGCGTARTLGVPSVAKNAFTVGAVQDFVDGNGDPGTVTCWSSRGPCGDGRWKPNVVGTGCVTDSTRAYTGNQYWTKCGCSMATPATSGVLAGVAEKYFDFRASSPLARAWAMATAVTWQDAGNATWGTLPSTHLNAYGMGRISGLKSHEGGGGYDWHRTWARGTITAETDTFDFTVFSGATRLIAVMTFDDPQSSSGASSAAVEDIDIYLDVEPFSSSNNAGEYWGLSAINTVEHIVINNPPVGNWRTKIYPYRNGTSNLRWGCMIIQIFGDSTPSGALSVTADDVYIQPGQSIAVDVEARTDSYVATNLYLDKQGHTGFNHTGSSMTLKDGRVLTNRHDGGGDMVLGDIADVSSTNRSRTVRHTFTENSGANAVRTITFQGRSDNWGTRTTSATVTVDGIAPPLPTSLRSTTHTVSGWSNNRTISFAWNQAADNLSGVEGYGEFWSTVNPTGVGAILDFPFATTRTITVASDYSTLYYGLRGVDRSGNWTTEVTTGPYGIDTVLPGVATNITSSTHPVGAWRNNATVSYAWTGATDDRSGVNGYGRLTNNSAVGAPPTTQNLGAVTSHAETLSSSTSGWYFKLRTVDRAGNWSTGFASYGPFYIDTVVPSGPSGLASPTHTVNAWTTVTNATVTWAAATDAHSGLSGYSVLWDQSASTAAPTTRNTAAGVTSASRVLGSSPNGWYFHIRAVDVAGNWGPTVHFGPLRVDTTPPAGPTGLGSSSHTVNTWSSNLSVQTGWNAATDGQSGLSGYASVWDQAAGTVPAIVNLGAASTSRTQTLASSSTGYYFHIRARDVAGNWGIAQHFGPVLLDNVPPSGTSLVINAGSSETTTVNVTLAVAASDAHSGMSQMRFRNDGGTWTAWQAFSAGRSWNLTNNGGSTATGTRRVDLEVRDVAGNVAAASDTIYYYVPVSYFGTACNGSLGQPTFFISGIPGLGRPVSFVAGNTAATAGVLYAGISNTMWSGIALPLDLVVIGVPGCFVNVSLDVTFYSGPIAPLNLTIPVDTALVGVSVHYQWHLFGDPSGRLVVTTRGATATTAGL